LAQAPAVVWRTRDEELESRGAERVLAVDGEQAGPNAVLGRGPDPVLLRPRRRLDGPRLVVDAPHLRYALGPEMGRDRERARHATALTLRLSGPAADGPSERRDPCSGRNRPDCPHVASAADDLPHRLSTQ